MLDDPPDPGVMPAGHPRRRRDRHLLGAGQHRHLEQQREPAARTGLRHLRQMHAVLGAPHPRHPRHPRRQERPMPEQVQMPPTLLRRVMHRARRVDAPRLRAEEPGGTREVQPDIEPTGLLVELHRDHPPRHGRPERSPEHRVHSQPVHQTTGFLDRPATATGTITGCRRSTSRPHETARSPSKARADCAALPLRGRPLLHRSSQPGPLP